MANSTAKPEAASSPGTGHHGIAADRSVIGRAARLLVVCVVLATVATTTLFQYQDVVYRGAGGGIHRTSQVSSKEALQEAYPNRSPEELDHLRPVIKDGTLYVSHTRTAYWVYQAFHNGWVQYAILTGFLTGLLYTIGVWVRRLIPGWHFSSAPRRFREIAEQMIEMRKTGAKNIEEIIEKIDGNDRFADRLHKLQQHYKREPSRQLCREANDAYSQSEQTEAIYVMLPLGFIEFVLPIFGFIGTVLGVIDAVAGLRSGMSRLFQDRELTQEVMSQFMAGFDGLVLAFMTTLFGLLGLALTASFHFYLRRNAMAVIAKVDEWSEEAINLLPQEDTQEKLLKTIEEALIEENENGQRVPRLQRLDELVREAMFEPDQNGEKPVPRLQRMEKLLHQGLFEPSSNGDEVPALQGVGRMIQVATDSVRRIHNALMHHIYQIVGEDDRNQYTPLTVYTTDEETGETYSTEMLGRYRFERQHADTVAWMRMLTEEVIRHIDRDINVIKPRGDGKDEGGNGIGTSGWGILIIAPNEEPVRQIAASTAAFAVVRGTDHATGESELISGCYEAVMGQMLPHEADRKRLPMAITGLGFSAGEGTEATRFGAYMPLAPMDPWQQHGARQLLPTKPLVRCAPAFLSDHEVLSTNVAFTKIGGLTWLLFLTREVGKTKAGKIGLFALPLESEQGIPQQIGELMEGHLTAEAVFHGKAYAFALRHGGGASIAVAYPGENQPAVRFIKGKADVTALTFDSAGVLHYATQDRKIGTVIVEEGRLQHECQLDRPGQIAHLTHSSDGLVYAAMRDSAELLLVRMNGGKQPELRSVDYPRLITTLTASSDGNAVFVGCADGSVYKRNG